MSSRSCLGCALTLVAFATIGFEVSAHSLQETPPQEPASDAPWQDLVTSFDAEFKDWNARVRAAKGGRERSSLRRENPTLRFASAFESLADSGEIRATFWLLDHLPDLGGRNAERKARRLALYECMIRDHGESKHFIEGMSHLHADSRLRRDHGLDTIERLTGVAMRTLTSEAARDSLRVGLALCTAKLREPASTAKAVALLDEVLASKRLTPKELKEATKLRFELLYLRLGCQAPDFEGLTVDKDPVRLSDTRGKVVVLDFFGFW